MDDADRFLIYQLFDLSMAQLGQVTPQRVLNYIILGLLSKVHGGASTLKIMLAI
jgi:hypothetical protein